MRELKIHFLIQSLPKIVRLIHIHPQLKKENVVENHKPIIFNGKKLTPAGHLQLSAFTQEIIDIGVQALNTSIPGSITNPLGWLIKYCGDIYKKMKVAPNYSRLNQERRKYCLTGDESDWEKIEDQGANSPLEIAESGALTKQIIKVFYSPEQVEAHVRAIENTPFFRSLNSGQSPRERFAEELKNGEWVSRTREEWERHEAAMKKHNAIFSAFEEKIAGDQQWKRERGYKQDFATSTEEESFTKTEMARPQVELSAHVPVVGVLKKVNSEEVYEYEGIDSDFDGIDSVDQIDIFVDSLPKTLGAKDMRYGVHSPYI